MTVDTDADLAHYQSYIEEMARRADATMIVANSNAYDAVVLRQLISMAENSIKIMTGTLTENVFGQKIVLDALSSKCQYRPDMSILVLHEFSLHSDNSFKRILDRDGGTNIHIRRLSGSTSMPVRFTVVDESHFRFEPDKKADTIVYFGDRHNAQRISKIFDGLWAESA